MRLANLPIHPGLKCSKIRERYVCADDGVPKVSKEGTVLREVSVSRLWIYAVIEALWTLQPCGANRQTVF